MTGKNDNEGCSPEEDIPSAEATAIGGTNISQVELIYNPKKPKWWNKVSGNPSKAQKRATNQVFETHRLASIPYGEFINWNNYFHAEDEIWVEVGFGRGENLLALAHQKRNEAISYVGIEINRSGMGTACQRIKQGMENNSFWCGYDAYSSSLDPCRLSDDKIAKGCEFPDDRDMDKECQGNKQDCSDVEFIPATGHRPYSNVRLWPGDGVKLFPKIPSSSIATILVTFPDPFPRNNEKPWRLIQPASLKEIHRILRKTTSSPGRLFLATDHEGYFEWSSKCIEELNKECFLFEKVDRCPSREEWLPAVSRYERKGWEEGRKTMLCCWVARASDSWDV